VEEAVSVDFSQMTPFIYDSDANVTIAVNGGPVAVPEGLRCPFRVPMLVDEIRFTTYSAAFPALRATIYVGRIPVCEDVPLELLGKPMDIGAEMNLSNASGATQTFAFHIWRLPKPLLLPKAGRVDVRLSYDNRSGLLTHAAATISPSVAILGRALPDDVKLPAKVNVPFANRWIAPLAPTTQGDILVSQSLPADLKNTTTHPLYVQRFSAALTGVDTGGYAIDDAQGAALNCKVRIYGEAGVLGVRDQTPVGVLMHHGNRTWMANTILQPGGYYIADVDYVTTNLGTQRIFTPQLGIGMVGHHEVPIDELGIALD
jgi:hypothetical protein